MCIRDRAIITFYNLEWGFLLFVGMVLLFDQFPPSGFETSVIGTEYFDNLKGLSFLSGVSFAVVSPLELQLLLIFAVWVLHIATGRSVLLQRVPIWPIALLFYLALIVATIYGLRRGGDFLVSLWELRALFYLGVMYLLVP